MQRVSIVEPFSLEQDTLEAIGNMYDEQETGRITKVSTIQTKRGSELLVYDSMLMTPKIKQVNEPSVMRWSGDIIKSPDLTYNVVVKEKIKDILFPYDEDFRSIGPINPINSDGDKIFISEDAAERIADHINFDMFDEELSEIHHIDANSEHKRHADIVMSLRRKIAAIKHNMINKKRDLAAREPMFGNMTTEQILAQCINGSYGDSAREYIRLYEELCKTENEINLITSNVVLDVYPRVYVPGEIDESDIVAPSFKTGRLEEVGQYIGEMSLQNIRNGNVTKSDDPIIVI